MRAILFVVLALGVVAVSAFPAQPEDAVLAEFLVGTVCSFAGGVGGAYVLAWAFAAGETGWEAFGRAIVGAILGYTGGTILGASLGVAATGTLLGIEGNIGLCFLGATAGTGIAFGIGFALNLGDPAFFFIPPFAAAGATAGFNVGARPRS